MDGTILVLGYGPCGRATVQQLREAGRHVVVAQRQRPADLPVGMEFRPCDITDAAAVHQAMQGCSAMVLAIGLPYDRRVWRETWPRAMANALEACAAAEARLVFLDNLYMLGPQNAQLREDMPLCDHGAKPAIRAAVTRQWMEATGAGRVRVAALRAPDFYGPGVGNSHIGASGLQAIALGKTAMLIAPPDTPHDFAYVPDIARAAVTLLDAPDDAYGQAWNVPCAPTRTPREILTLGAAALGKAPKIRAVPLGLLPVLGLAVPFLREVGEMRFTFDRPYRADWSKWRRRFGPAVTSFEQGVPATVRSFQPSAGAGQSVLTPQ